ncbi:MAG: hypothetical protein L7R85_06300, partial [Synechococcus sp. MOX_bin13]|nr:hypothetical protein [Synechococcus sp. MOX_bin13]
AWVRHHQKGLYLKVLRCLSRTQVHPILAVSFLLEAARLLRRTSSPVDCIVSKGFWTKSSKEKIKKYLSDT